jgi:hypothetical protein
VKCFNNWGKHKAFIDRRQDCSRGEYIEKWRKMNVQNHSPPTPPLLLLLLLLLLLPLTGMS